MNRLEVEVTRIESSWHWYVEDPAGRPLMWNATPFARRELAEQDALNVFARWKHAGWPIFGENYAL